MKLKSTATEAVQKMVIVNLCMQGYHAENPSDYLRDIAKTVLSEAEFEDIKRREGWT